MRPAAVRLLAFALVIFGSFGSAYSLGRRLPGNPESKPHTHGKVAPSPIPPGFEVDGYVLVNNADQPSASAVALHVKAPDGQRVTDFTVTQGADLHVVLIRPDLSGFEHLTPDVGADGSFVVPVGHGKWHIIVDAQPAGANAPIVLATNVDDEVEAKTISLPKPADTMKVGDLVVIRNGLQFTVTGNDGGPAQGLEPYLGHPAQLIALRQTTLAYHHLLPAASAPTSPATFGFDGTLPSGTYRLFLQFGFGGAVQTAAFTMVQP